jgi:hypothetical protein
MVIFLSVFLSQDWVLRGVSLLLDIYPKVVMLPQKRYEHVHIYWPGRRAHDP